MLRLQTERDVSTAITAGALHAWPVFEAGHQDVNQLSEEVLHVLSVQFRLSGHGISTGRNVPLGKTGPRLVCLHLDI